MKKKAQVTLFVIIAIVLVALVVLFFVFKDSLNFSSSNIDANPIHTSVQTCLEDVGEEVIFGVGEGGGYFYPTSFSTSSGVTYYWMNNENNMPSLEEIEDEISEVIGEKLELCAGNFSNFPNYQVDSKPPVVETSIRENEVSLFVEFPIRILKGDERVVLEEFKQKFPVRLGFVYDVVKEIVDEEPLREGICLSCIFDVSLGTGLTIDMLDYDETTTIFVVEDEESEMDGNVFEFRFANNYENGL